MNESFDLDDQVVALRRAGPAARPGAPVGSRSVEVSTESDRESLAGRSSLGRGLAHITSRLLDQLATGGDCAQRGDMAQCSSVATPGNAQRDSRGNRVPWDQSQLVSWRRVVAVSTGGSLLALVSLPLPA
jgi:hypothetical protein